MAVSVAVCEIFSVKEWCHLNMLSCFHPIPERYGQTDGQTGRTDRIVISISRVGVLTRDKNSKRNTNAYCTVFRYSFYCATST